MVVVSSRLVDHRNDHTKHYERVSHSSSPAFKIAGWTSIHEMKVPQQCEKKSQTLTNQHACCACALSLILERFSAGQGGENSPDTFPYSSPNSEWAVLNTFESGSEIEMILSFGATHQVRN